MLNKCCVLCPHRWLVPAVFSWQGKWRKPLRNVRTSSKQPAAYWMTCSLPSLEMTLRCSIPLWHFFTLLLWVLYVQVKTNRTVPWREIFVVLWQGKGKTNRPNQQETHKHCHHNLCFIHVFRCPPSHLSHMQVHTCIFLQTHTHTQLSLYLSQNHTQTHTHPPVHNCITMQYMGTKGLIPPELTVTYS